MWRADAPICVLRARDTRGRGWDQPKRGQCMQAYILLDRSGSMQSLWVEALSSVNAFAKELANKKMARPSTAT